MRRSSAVRCAVLVVAALLTGCAADADAPPSVSPETSVPPDPSTAESPGPTAGALAQYYDQRLDWQDCGQQLQCADLAVPRDYTDPAAGDLQIAVARYRRSGGDARPALVVNPGGPGGSGVEYVRSGPLVVSPVVLDEYDLVGFDPRGVGDSDPVDCLSNAETDDVIAGDPDPDTPEQIAELEEDARTIAAGCQRRSGELLGFIDTGSVVKDMDILRAALGPGPLNYLGKSYGSKLGALYAHDFPQNTGRMVLDGVLPPDLSGTQISQGQALGFEDALRRYVEWCQSSGRQCPLSGDGADAGVIEVQRLLQRLEQQPLPAGDRELTEGLALQAILYYLYYPYAGDWRRLNDGLRDALAGDGATLVEMLDERLRRGSDGRYANGGNAYDAFIAVSCLDSQGDAAAEELAERAEEWAREAPTFGPALSWSEYVCSQWPVGAKGRPRVVTAEGAGPILVLAATHDPATPLQWAQDLAEDLADARLVVLDGDGHTAYFNGSACIDRAVAEYLLDGNVPVEGTTCEDGRTA